MIYVEAIERALGIHEPDKTKVRFQTFDMERKIGVLWEEDGERCVISADFITGWEKHVIREAEAWRDSRKIILPTLSTELTGLVQ